MQRKVLILIMMGLILFAGKAQTKEGAPTTINSSQDQTVALLSRIDSLLMINEALLKQLEKNTSLIERYKLYPTENIYTLLQLDTMTGKVDQVQWSLDSSEEFSMTINSRDLSFGLGYSSGSFELYPTKNMYQFILIDKTDGRKWHIQWGTGGSTSRWIRRIY